jgi:hypothetical protein
MVSCSTIYILKGNRIAVVLTRIRRKETPFENIFIWLLKELVDYSLR